MPIDSSPEKAQQWRSENMRRHGIPLYNFFHIKKFIFFFLVESTLTFIFVRITTQRLSIISGILHVLACAGVEARAAKQKTCCSLDKDNALRYKTCLCMLFLLRPNWVHYLFLCRLLSLPRQTIPKTEVLRRRNK